MSTDNPYASPEAEAAHRLLAEGDELVEQARNVARNAAILGTIALICGVFSQCTSCVSLIPGVVLGLLAFQQARTAKAMAPDDRPTGDLAMVGTVGGLVVAGFGALMLTFVFLYVMVYVVLIGVMVVVGP